ncbi:MAG: STAS domain-containing protein [Myxococcota bacterium]
MPQSRDELAQTVVDYLVQMQQGNCSITEEQIEAEFETDNAMCQVLAGLLFMHQDLKLKDEKRRSAEEQLVQRNAELERSRAELAAFAAELSTPIIRVWRGILMLPIVGSLDHRRAGEITDRLLNEVNAQSASHVILDLTGVLTVDTSTADQLVQIVGAVRLLGAHALIAGIQPEVSNALVALGLDLSRLHATRTTEDAVRIALQTTRASLGGRA